MTEVHHVVLEGSSSLGALAELLNGLNEQREARFIYCLTRYLSQAPSFTGLHPSTQGIILYHRAGAMAAAELEDMGWRTMERAVLAMRSFRKRVKTYTRLGGTQFSKTLRQVDKMLRTFDSRLRYCKAKAQSLGQGAVEENLSETYNSDYFKRHRAILITLPEREASLRINVVRETRDARSLNGYLRSQRKPCLVIYSRARA